MLLLKFGRLALLDDLSGSVGQATPPRPADRIVTEAGAAAGRAAMGAWVAEAQLVPTAELAGREPADPEGETQTAPAPADARETGPAESNPLQATPVRSPSTARGRRRGRRHRGRGGPPAVAPAVLAGLDDDATDDLDPA
jgi:hypothetical protein